MAYRNYSNDDIAAICIQIENDMSDQERYLRMLSELVLVLLEDYTEKDPEKQRAIEEFKGHFLPF